MQVRFVSGVRISIYFFFFFCECSGQRPFVFLVCAIVRPAQEFYSINVWLVVPAKRMNVLFFLSFFLFFSSVKLIFVCSNFHTYSTRKVSGEKIFGIVVAIHPIVSFFNGLTKLYFIRHAVQCVRTRSLNKLEIKGATTQQRMTVEWCKRLRWLHCIHKKSTKWQWGKITEELRTRYNY